MPHISGFNLPCACRWNPCFWHSASSLQASNCKTFQMMSAIPLVTEMVAQTCTDSMSFLKIGILVPWSENSAHRNDQLWIGQRLSTKWYVQFNGPKKDWYSQTPPFQQQLPKLMHTDFHNCALCIYIYIYTYMIFRSHQSLDVDIRCIYTRS